jgi:Lon protease-like protein
MKIPLFPLDLVLFPGAPLPLHIFEDRYKEMINLCLQSNAGFGVVRAQREGLATVGCTAKILRVMHRYPDGRMDILCEGDQRFEIETLENELSYLEAQVDLFEDEDEEAPQSLKKECLAMHFEAMALAGIEAPETSIDLNGPISFRLASSLPADLGFKQQLLNFRSDAERTRRLHAFYLAVLPKLRAGAASQNAAAHNGHVM